MPCYTERERGEEEKFKLDITFIAIFKIKLGKIYIINIYNYKYREMHLYFS